MLGAEYSDFTGQQYTSIGQHDMHLFEAGAVVLAYDRPEHDYVAGRNDLRTWNAPNVEGDDTLA
jgi:hypothetical protein